MLLAATLASWAVVVPTMLAALLLEMEWPISGEAAFALLNVGLVIAFYGFFVALFVCLALGLPALVIAQLLHLDKLWQAATTGTLAGAVVAIGALALPRPFGAGYDWDDLVQVFVFVLAGALAGIAAWRARARGAAR